MKKTEFDHALSTVGWVGMIGMTFWGAVMWGDIPQKVPLNYNIRGEIDRMGDKSELLILFCIAWGFYLLLGLVTRIPAKYWNTGVAVTEENKKRVYRTLGHMIRSLPVFGGLVFMFSMLASGKLIPVSPWVNTAVMLGGFPVLLVAWLIRLVYVSRPKYPAC